MNSRTRTFRFCLAGGFLLLPLAAADAQTAATASAGSAASTGAIQPIATLRVRAEGWNWFDTGPEGEYAVAHALARFGATQTRGAWQWRLEAGSLTYIGSPDDASLPGAQGGLGLGQSYYDANEQRSTVTSLFLRQGFLRWSGEGHAIRAGRFEFAEGIERRVADPTLAAIKSQRVAQRLVGPFGFSPAQRGFDGAQYSFDRGANNVTVVAMRPASGAFRADAGPGLDIDMAYASFNRGAQRATGESEFRVFGLHYSDHRGTVPTDNRPLAARLADRGDITVSTIGGHWVGTHKAGRATFDGLVWGALQSGDWGTQEHSANAVAVEGGVQHESFPASLWLRAGWLRTSGDEDATDGEHGAFFQVTPTPRVYALFPFYNMMNSSDVFVTAAIKPAKTLTVRGGVHSVSLTESTDSWYFGGGAFESRSFGFGGRPSGGSTSLATVTDVTVIWQARPKLAIELYGATAQGGDVIKGIYGGSGTGSLLFLQTTWTR